jgi:hypothetical protein
VDGPPNRASRRDGLGVRASIVEKTSAPTDGIVIKGICGAFYFCGNKMATTIQLRGAMNCAGERDLRLTSLHHGTMTGSKSQLAPTSNRITPRAILLPIPSNLRLLMAYWREFTGTVCKINPIVSAGKLSCAMSSPVHRCAALLPRASATCSLPRHASVARARNGRWISMTTPGRTARVTGASTVLAMPLLVCWRAKATILP